MVRMKKKKCRHCGTLFLPDARNAKRQEYCAKPECKKASKKASQQRWLQKPENKNYFKGPTNVQRVQEWRKVHPGYSRRKPAQANALQDSSIAQPVENKKNNIDLANNALQDLLIAQPTVIIGLIANLTGLALQDDIAMTLLRMQQLGSDIINPKRKGGKHGAKTSHLSPACSQSSQPVQLDRSALGP